MEPAKPMKKSLTKHQQAVAMTLRNLERKGLIDRGWIKRENSAGTSPTKAAESGPTRRT